MSPVLVSAEQCVRPIGNSVFSLSTPPQSCHKNCSIVKRKSKLSGRQNITRKNFPDRARNSFLRQNCPKLHKSLLHTCHVYYGTNDRKLMTLCRNFPDCPKTFHAAGNFADVPETFCTDRTFQTVKN